MTQVLAIHGSFPVAREEHYLTRANRLEDATEYRSPERLTPLYRWEIGLEGLSATEVQALEDRFRSMGGRYGTFAFLDSLENLLQWSEDFGQAVWVASGPLALAGGQPDPLGGTAAQALTNTGAGPNAITQMLAAPPAGIQFTGSLWLRADASVTVTLLLTDGDVETYTALAGAGLSWQRFSITATFSAGNGSGQFGFGFELPAGAAVYAFGAQLMALPAPAPYVRTTTVSGFHPRCRFGDDTFRHRLTGPGHSEVRLSIVELA